MLNGDDFRFIKYVNAGSRRFSYWVTFMDMRPSKRKSGKQARKELIKFWSQTLGDLGTSWEYSSFANNLFIIKLNKETDVTMMLLKYHR